MGEVPSLQSPHRVVIQSKPDDDDDNNDDDYNFDYQNDNDNHNIDGHNNDCQNDNDNHNDYDHKNDYQIDNDNHDDHNDDDYKDDCHNDNHDDNDDLETEARPLSASPGTLLSRLWLSCSTAKVSPVKEFSSTLRIWLWERSSSSSLSNWRKVPPVTKCFLLYQEQN